MRVGLSYDLKETVVLKDASMDDALEEYDSPATIEYIKHALEGIGHSVVKLGGGKEFIRNILQEPVDIVFNISEGRGNYRSREAQVPSILEMLDIPYVGSDPQCLSVCLDKVLTKKLIAQDGIPTPSWRTIASSKELNTTSWHDFPFPAIVKPAYEGSSKGVHHNSLVDNQAQAIETIAEILEAYRQPVMVEQFIEGDEITVGVIGNSPPKVLGLMRIIPRKNNSRFVYTVEVKRDWKNLVDYECPARLNKETAEKIRTCSLKVFEVLGCRDFSRIDFRVSVDGIPYMLEINPLPGLGDYSDLVIMAAKLGWKHEALIASVFNAALERYPLCVGR
ncbi:MAG: ATP-grasp domain-containing protein [Dehalococcoidales bacterium]|nr:ATP-grasp domain-containing protein [Dehalococcoidales bacterium]